MDTPLVNTEDLRVYLQIDAEDYLLDTAEIAVQLADGWLESVTPFVLAWPSPRRNDLWAWALELAGMAYDNPEGMSLHTTGGTTSGWMQGRRQEILAAAKRKYPLGGPQYQFPDPPSPLPDG